MDSKHHPEPQEVKNRWMAPIRNKSPFFRSNLPCILKEKLRLQNSQNSEKINTLRHQHLFTNLLSMFSGHPLDDEKMIFQNKPFLRPRTPHGPASMAPP